jgi:hypothetical protein
MAFGHRFAGEEIVGLGHEKSFRRAIEARNAWGRTGERIL